MNIVSKETLWNEFSSITLRKVNAKLLPVGETFVIDASYPSKELWFEQFDEKIIMMRPRPCIMIDKDTGIKSPSSGVSWRFWKFEVLEVLNKDNIVVKELEAKRNELGMGRSYRRTK